MRLPAVHRCFTPVRQLEPGDILEVRLGRHGHPEAARIVEVTAFNPMYRNFSARTDDGRREEGEASVMDAVARYVCSGYEATPADKGRSVLAAVA